MSLTKKTILSLTIIIILIVGFTLPSFADLGAFEPAFTVTQENVEGTIYEVTATLNSKNGAVWFFEFDGDTSFNSTYYGGTINTTYPYNRFFLQPFTAISTDALNQAVEGSILSFDIVIENNVWASLGFRAPSSTYGNFIFYNEGDSTNKVDSVISLMSVTWTQGNSFVTGHCEINLNAFNYDYDYWSLEACLDWGSDYYTGAFTYSLLNFQLKFKYDTAVVTPDYIQNIDGTLTEIKDEFQLDSDRNNILDNLQQGAQEEISKAEDIDDSINNVLDKVDTNFNPVTVVSNALNNNDKVYFENKASTFGDFASIFLLVGVSVGFIKFLVFGKG